MKKIILCISALAAMITALNSCKTTEANYRAAYERAINRQNEGIDSATLSAIEREEGPRNMRLSDSISLPGVSRFVRVTEGGGGTRENLKLYSIVVGKFRQVFNAKSMRERLVDSGAYPGAFVVQAGEDFLVIAFSTDSPEEALSAYRALKDNGIISMKAPLPWVLRRPR